MRSSSSPDSNKNTLNVFRYWSTAEEARSKFIERVEKWEEKMVPILEEEETRPEFSIHDYGTKILDKFSDGVGSSVAFSDVCF